MAKTKKSSKARSCQCNCSEGKKIKWEAVSVIVAMFLFIANIGWTIIHDQMEKSDRRNNIRTIIAYEIYKNKKSINFIYGTKNIRQHKNISNEDLDIHPIYFDNLAKIKLSILSSIDDKIFKTYSNQINVLPPNEIAQLMGYYEALTELKNGIPIAVQILKSDSQKKEIESIELRLNNTFMRVLSLSDRLSRQYEKYIPEKNNIGCNNLTCDDDNNPQG
ncbi:hypothetical protein [Escherichia coli]|uniref:hypothetical protein n=1 Tax=Escherichia coli TaxID=562 RepID=UPI0015D5F6CD|nr:hypothetical protein [Escherichia coli]HAL6726441.1 hypothetical protein [Escherichia coli]